MQRYTTDLAWLIVIQYRVVQKKRKTTFGGHFEIFPGGN